MPAAAGEATSAPSSSADGAGDASAPGAPGQQPVQQQQQQQLQAGRIIATALFVMALRDPSLKRSMRVPPLHPETPLEQQLAAAGAARNRWAAPCAPT